MLNAWFVEYAGVGQVELSCDVLIDDQAFNIGLCTIPPVI
jgi:hypothetical protein